MSGADPGGARSSGARPRGASPVVGVVHPGDMGAAVAACLQASGHAVAWASAGRSPATAARVEALGLRDLGTLAGLREGCDVIVSVCPPHAALDVAAALAGFEGTYVDANAVSPATAQRVRDVVTTGGADYVDGGLVGPPPRTPGTTRLFLSGPRAGEVAALLAGSDLEPIVLPADGPAGDCAASALKMAYATWTKGSAALLMTARAIARAAGVEDALVAEWGRSLPGLPDQSVVAASVGLERGWRWSFELAETGRTAGAAGLPEGFGAAAAQVYSALAAGTDGAVRTAPGEDRTEVALRRLLGPA